MRRRGEWTRLTHTSGRLVILIAVLLSGFCSTSFAQELTRGDGVRLTLFNVSDAISGDYYIQNDWHIQLPFIGLIDTRERSFPSIRAEIIEKYESIYRSPELTVQPLFKVSVLGEVNNPGLFYVTGVEKLTDLLAMAGGETEDANLNKIYLVREDQRININAKKIMREGERLNDLGLSSGDQVYVARRTLNFRTTSILFSGITALVAVISLYLSSR